MKDSKLEDEIFRLGFSLKAWWNYIHSLTEVDFSNRFQCYEKALTFLPRSFKLWHAYLQERESHVKQKSPNSRFADLVIDTYERALVNLNKMPRIWLDFARFLIWSGRISKTREVFDRALQALPVTQHGEIWQLYVQWGVDLNDDIMATHIYQRFLLFDPTRREDYINILKSFGRFGDAVKHISVCLNDPNFISIQGNSYHHMWIDLCNMCSKYPKLVQNHINVENLIRSGIQKFSDEVGRLWNNLAEFYVRQGLFEKAKDIFEEALDSVSTVRDFTIVFDSYIKVEESIVTAKMKFLNNLELDEEVSEEEKNEERQEIEMKLSRIEHLVEKRPLLISNVLLRQNPHNVHEWKKRFRLLKKGKSNDQLLLSYADSVNVIDPAKAVGRFSGIWINWAKEYESIGDLDNMRNVFANGSKVVFKADDETASIWCSWAEAEIRHRDLVAAYRIMRTAVDEAVSRKENSVEHAIILKRLRKSTKVWELYLDLEEMVGSLDSCRAAYNRAFDLKITTVQMAINYATLLEENDFFEESFQVYEKAVSLFEFPQCKIIWLIYLEKFEKRYGEAKLIRLEDLYEQVLTKVPPQDSVEFFINFANAVQHLGAPRHVIPIYERAIKSVPELNKLELIRLYVKKVELLFGILKTRNIYSDGLKTLNDEMAMHLALDYAAMERKLGEIDRARAIFVYGSQFADTRREPGYWQEWRDFEELHGNEETFKDMLRLRKSVEAAFSQVNYTVSEIVQALKSKSETESAGKRKIDQVSEDNQIEDQEGQPVNKSLKLNEEEIEI